MSSKAESSNQSDQEVEQSSEEKDETQEKVNQKNSNTEIRKKGNPVITSYSIHYTKLYEK